MTKNICISLHCDSEALTITERKQTKVINILKFAELSHKKESSPSVRSVPECARQNLWLKSLHVSEIFCIFAL